MTAEVILGNKKKKEREKNIKIWRRRNFIFFLFFAMESG
jgi:hypothetical protein